MIGVLLVTLAIWIGELPNTQVTFISKELPNLGNCEQVAVDVIGEFLAAHPDEKIAGVGYGCGEIRMMLIRRPDGGPTPEQPEPSLPNLQRGA